MLPRPFRGSKGAFYIEAEMARGQPARRFDFTHVAWPGDCLLKGEERVLVAIPRGHEGSRIPELNTKPSPFIGQRYGQFLMAWTGDGDFAERWCLTLEFGEGRPIDQSLLVPGFHRLSLSAECLLSTDSVEKLGKALPLPLSTQIAKNRS